MTFKSYRLADRHDWNYIPCHFVGDQ